MKIVLLEHQDVEYPVVGYGGIQRINQNLYEGFADFGHEVTLICAERNKYIYRDKTKLINLKHEDIQRLIKGEIRLSDLVNNVDIFQTHTSTENVKFCFEGFNGTWISTCHGEHEDTFCPNQIFVSYNQYLQHIAEFGLNFRPFDYFVCHNGIKTTEMYITPGPHNRVVWLSHICPAKGAHFLPSIADAINEKILMAGNISDQGYFDHYVKPYIGSYIEYIGPIKTEKEKREFFSNARLSLHLAITQECFATTILESQRCGVPVFSFNIGSAYEINYDHKNIFNSVDALSKAIKDKQYKKISSVDLSNWTKRRFSKEAMTKRYLNVYREVLNV